MVVDPWFKCLNYLSMVKVSKLSIHNKTSCQMHYYNEESKIRVESLQTKPRLQDTQLLNKKKIARQYE